MAEMALDPRSVVSPSSEAPKVSRHSCRSRSDRPNPFRPSPTIGGARTSPSELRQANTKAPEATFRAESGQ